MEKTCLTMSHQPQQDVGQQNSLSSIDVLDMSSLIYFFSFNFYFYYVWWGNKRSCQHMCLSQTQIGGGGGGGVAGEEEQCCHSLWMSQRMHVEAFVGVNNNMGWCHDTLCMSQASRMSGSTCTVSLMGRHQSFIEQVLRSLQLPQSPIKTLDKLGTTEGDVYWN